MILQSSKPKRFLAHYYDTEDRVLEKQLCSLRARKEGNLWRAAFKLKGKMVNGFSQREEYECDISGWLTCANDLPETELKTRVSDYLNLHSSLYSSVTTDTQRTVINLKMRLCDVEMVLDNAVITGENGQITLHEVELELKSGEVAEMIDLGNWLHEQFSLTPSKVTKHQIGLSLS